MLERLRACGSRAAGLALLMMGLLLAAAPAGAQRWELAGEALRRLHAESLEEVLRACPLLVVERLGAPGLPWRAQAGAARPGELLLVVDGEPWRDAWSGEWLAEELPMGLVEAVAVELSPQTAEFGTVAIAGVIRVTTRRPSEPKVTTRLQLSRGRFAERGRHVAFSTPPGELALSVSLDEYFNEGYPFSLVWNGEPDFQSADPEIGLSRRRSLATRLGLAGGAAGPIELALDQSEWHLDRHGSRTDPWYREQTRFALALPGSPIGELRLEQRLIERRSADGRANAAALALRWAVGADSLGGGWRLLAGAERQQLGWRSRVAPLATLPRPARLWLGAQWSGEASAALALAAGLRVEAEHEQRGGLAGEASLRWRLPRPGAELSASLAAGPATTAWERERLPGSGLWPAGAGAPGEAAADAQPLLRAVLALAQRGARSWVRLVGAAERGGQDWLAQAAGDGYQWQSRAGEDRRSLDLILGAQLRGLGGEMKATAGLRAEQRERAAPAAEGSFYPLVARGELALGRPFFAADARLGLSGGVELRSGRSDHGDLTTIDLGVELQVIDARFWLRVTNALEWAGEEVPGFPIPPASLRLGLDWHLDQ